MNRILFFLTLFFIPLAASAKVKLGNQVLAEHNFKELKGKRLGLITNPSGVNHELKSIMDVLRQAPGVKLTTLLAPEHGIFGDVIAGKHVANQTEPRTGLPVFSIYGKTRKPTPEMLKGLDAVVYDLQDTGCRSYTFISTMGLAMQACAENKIEFIVLDRPNPLGGERIEGPIVEDRFRSFVSQWNIPYIYGMTAGELARMINGEGWVTNRCKLTIIPMRGWKRSMLWQDTGLPWVPTSPHIPHADSPLFYAASGVLGELPVSSIGVGYTLPFQCVARPGIDGHAMAEMMNGYKLPGVQFRAVTYKPFYARFTNQNVSGVQLYFSDPRRAPLTPLNLYFFDSLKKLSGADLFAETAKASTNNIIGMFDKVMGTDSVRKALQSGTPPSEIVRSWKADEEYFRKQRKKYLIY